ncbi:GerAB/ArcD/ProY family transporter [Bacillus haimaensis]|uniref:GerAB/ArcD/ProY family transporter n=1 Tax=Bacillus haimaensis TaxID=3160967 RepID=UPI003AA8D31F
MKNNSISITKFQLIFFLVQSQLGIGLLSLPNVVQSSAKGDGWISSLLAGLVVQLILIIYWLLLKRFPNEMYTDITKKILGRFLGKLLNAIIYLYFILTGSLALVLFIKITNLWLLPLTPSWILSLLIIGACIYLTMSDLRIIARFFVLASFLIILLVFLSFLTFSLPKDFTFILPIGSSGVKNILQGSNKSLISMLGFEALLLIYPFVINKRKGILKTISIANLFITFLYTFFIFLCLIIFNPNQLFLIKEPSLYIFRALSFTMMDRLDLIFLSIWIVPMTTSVIAYLFLAAKSISKKESYKKNVVISGSIIWLFSLIPLNENSIGLFSQYISYLSYFIVIGLPVILLCLSIIFNKTERSEPA